MFIQLTSPKYRKNIPVVIVSITREKIRQAILIGATSLCRIRSVPLATNASKTILAINGKATRGIDIQSINQATPHIRKKIANAPTDTIRM